MSGGIPKRITRMKTGIGYKPISGRWGLQGLETCARRNKVLCQYVKRRTGKSSLVWYGGSTLNDTNFLLAIDWWLGIPIDGNKYKVPPGSRVIIISIFGQIEDWKTDGVTDMANAFSASRNPKAATFNENIGGNNQPNGKWYTRNVTTMENMFKGAAAFDQDISPWDTQAMLNMSGMFNGATLFDNGESTLGWIKLSNVTNMSSMFKNAITFNQIIETWLVDDVTNMSSMFEGATAFHQDIGGVTGSWDVTKVTNMSSMFKNATTFDQNILGPGFWVTSAVTTMESMFEGANTFANAGVAFNVIALGRAIGDGGVSCKAMFKDCTHALPDLANDFVSNITDMSSMFEGTTNFSGVYAGAGLSWTTHQVTTMESMFKNATSFVGTAIGANWDVSDVTNMSSMFKNATSFVGTAIGANWDVSDVTNMSSMFEGATSFNQDISSWTTTAVTSMDSMFKNATSFVGTAIGANWDVSDVTNMSSMFEGATVFNEDLSTWNTVAVTDMSSMFNGAVIFDKNIRNWAVIITTLTTNMFQGATAFLVSFGADGGYSPGVVNTTGSPPRTPTDFFNQLLSSLGGSSGEYAWFAGDITTRFKAGDTIYGAPPAGSGFGTTAYITDSLLYPVAGSTRVRFTVVVAGQFVNTNYYNVLIT